MTGTCIRRWLRARMPGKAVSGGERGFTMVEVLASVALLAIAVTPMMGLFTLAPRFHVQREQQIRAAFLAQLRLEDVKQKLGSDFGSADYKKSSGSATDFDDGDSGGPDDFFPASDSKFRYTVDYSNDSGIKDLTIIVWYDGDSDNNIDTNEQWVELNTKVARRL